MYIRRQTWTQAIVSHLVAPGFRHITEVAPFFDIDKHWSVSNDDDVDPGASAAMAPSPEVEAFFVRNGRRCWNTHLRYEDLPTTGRRVARCIYITRDGMDSLESFYRHLSAQTEEDGGYTGDWDAFFEDYMNNRLWYGSWQENLESWSRVQQAAAEEERDGSNTNVLFLCYEDMLSRDGLLDAIGRIAKHIGCDASAERIAAIADKTSMRSMKADSAKYNPESVSWREDRGSFSFIGGPRNQLFDTNQRRRFREMTLACLSRFEKQTSSETPCLLRRYAEHGSCG